MPEDARVEEFVRLLGQHQRRIFTYVLSLIPNRTDAEEVLQETNLVLWREFSQFQSGTNFAAWACRVAFNQVLAWRKRRQRDRLLFSDEFLECVSREAVRVAEQSEERSEALASCIEKLPEGHRELLRLRYTDGLDIDAIAAKLRKTVDAVYRSLSRIRQSLYECVDRSSNSRSWL